jgi:hypothetical protein
MSEERAHCTVGEKKSKKNKVSDYKKLSAVFDRAMLTVYENNIFPTLSCVVVKIHKNISQSSDNRFCSK